MVSNQFNSAGIEVVCNDDAFQPLYTGGFINSFAFLMTYSEQDQLNHKLSGK